MTCAVAVLNFDAGAYVLRRQMQCLEKVQRLVSTTDFVFSVVNLNHWNALTVASAAAGVGCRRGLSKHQNAGQCGLLATAVRVKGRHQQQQQEPMLL
jgi:hypothetical protein